jgi:integrase
MRNNGVDYLTIVALMGHKSAKMLIERYGHLNDDTLRKAVKVFDEIEGQSSNCLQIVCKN